MSEKPHGHQVPEVQPHVVIVGGGFGGLEAAKALGHARVRVTLVDRRNHHVFQPLLYQVATAALNPANIASPIRRILRGYDNIEVLLGDVEFGQPRRQAPQADGWRDSFRLPDHRDSATHSYFGHEEWSADAPGLKSIEDALEIRRRILMAFEAAERARPTPVVNENGRPSWSSAVGQLASSWQELWPRSRGMTSFTNSIDSTRLDRESSCSKLALGSSFLYGGSLGEGPEATGSPRG